jgi:hypothetical protein
VRKKPRQDQDKGWLNNVTHLQTSITRHKDHIIKLELILRHKDHFHFCKESHLENLPLEDDKINKFSKVLKHPQ